ncbi:hypothetical protein [Coleofasciculus sp. E1-EBD-02]|uniref:hypothetical protein n=1 Tax=Coleofasciculus sp. E1-EBD-02 TaxID=3068481 RepID=UPI0032F4325D
MQRFAHEQLDKLIPSYRLSQGIFSVQKTNAIALHPKRDNNPSLDLERFPIKLSNSPLTPKRGK